MSLYLKSLDKIKDGCSYKINLKEKSLSINGKKIMEKGEVLIDESLIDEDDLVAIGIEPSNDVYENLEKLYALYESSIPSKRKRNSYFYAKPEEELTLNDLVFGKDRYEAQFALEAYVLFVFAKISDWRGKTWFWQSEKYENLVILKEWIEE